MKHVFYQRIEVSEATMNNLLERFPHLEKRWVETLFQVGKLNSRIVELSGDYESSKPTFHTQPKGREWYLTLPECVSENYSLPREIELATDEKGFICKVHEQSKEEELSMLKQYTGFDTSVLQKGVAVETTYHLMCEEKVVNFLVLECSEMNLKLIDSNKKVVNITPKEVSNEDVFIRILN